MKYINALFFIILLSFTCLINTQQVFDSVKTLLLNFKSDIQKEQNDSDARCAEEEKWINLQINKAIAVLAHRTKDVDDLKAHIAFLRNEIQETQNDINSRQNRIQANNRLLEQFKKERCENNLLFVKNLREHIESIEVIGLLRQDLLNYFSGGQKKTSFLEKFAEFSHLLDEEHKLMLSQLSLKIRNLPETHVLSANTNNYTTTRARTVQQQGTGHVDNSRGELKRLASPKFEDAQVYRKKLEAKVLRMVDGLVVHLKNSRDNLTKSEIKAAEDFAVFQTNLYKENAYLAEKIKELNVHLVDLNAQLNNSQLQLVRREKLRQQAEDHLKHLRQMKKEKQEYCHNETVRRTRELSDVSSAQSIFQTVLDKLSLRVKLRTQSNVEGKSYNNAQANSANVVQSQQSTEQSVATRQRQRNAVAYF